VTLCGWEHNRRLALASHWPCTDVSDLITYSLHAHGVFASASYYGITTLPVIYVSVATTMPRWLPCSAVLLSKVNTPSYTFLKKKFKNELHPFRRLPPKVKHTHMHTHTTCRISQTVTAVGWKLKHFEKTVNSLCIWNWRVARSIISPCNCTVAAILSW